MAITKISRKTELQKKSRTSNTFPVIPTSSVAYNKCPSTSSRTRQTPSHNFTLGPHLSDGGGYPKWTGAWKA